MKTISAIILFILSFLLSFFALDNNGKIFNVLSVEEGAQSLHIPKWLRIVLSLAIGVIGLFVTLILYKRCSLTINIIRLQIAYLCTAGAACIDLREYRIPNIFPAVMALSGIVCLSVIFFNKIDGGFSYIISSVVGTTLCAGSMIVVYLFTKGGIGMGDIKLLCSIALLCGANAIAGSAAIGAFLCGIVTIILLIAKKKSIKHGSLPFGPFVFIGLVFSMAFPIA